jgi:hypothetical protein
MEQNILRRKPQSAKVVWKYSVTYEDVSKSFRTGRLERQLQTVQLSLPLGAVVSLFCKSV